MHFSEIEEFCGEGGQFWDIYLTWNTTGSPDFPECFQKTALSWIPCLILFLLSPVEIYILYHGRRGQIPWTILNITKMTLCLILAMLSLVNVINSAILRSRDIFVPKVDLFTPSLHFFTFVLIFGFTLMEKRKGIQSSGVQFFVFLVWTVLELLIYRSYILKASDETSMLDSISYVTEMIKFPIIVVLFLLTWISDAIPINSKIEESNENPCPELSASFPSYLFFTWIDGLVLTGYRRDLERKDLWDLIPGNKTRPIYDTFQKHWKRELKRFSLISSFSTSDKDVESSAIRQRVTLKSKPDENVVEPSLLKVLFRSFGCLYFLAIILKLVSDFLLFVNPLVLDLLISFVKSDEPQWKGFLYAFTMLAVAIINVTLVARASHISYLVGMKVRSALIAAIYRKAMLLSNAGKRKYTLGEIVNLMSVDVQKMMDVVLYFIFVVTSPILFGVTMYLLWQRLGVAVFAGIAAMIITQSVTVTVLDYAKRLQIDQMQLKDSRIKLMNEILNGIKVLKLYGWEKCFMEIINGIRSREVVVLRKCSSFGLAMTFSWYTSSVLVTLTSFGTYVLMDPTHVLDANIAFVSFALFNVMQGPIMLMPMVIVTIIQASVSMKRIAGFLYCDEIDPDAVQYVHDEEHPITIENGIFNWGDHDLAILSDINLRVKDKSLVAVVGTVGAGKSSLLSAILGEMEKFSGKVTVSGSVAYVPQQAWLQNATLKDNILFGKQINESFYEKVIDACALRPDLQVLPAGDNTEIGEKGINLSGGQKQRISLARAVYSDANNYLLDDPLSAVDVHVGKHIFDHVIGPKGILKDKTRILVTHRITLLPQVDLIVVVNNGAISEIGTYRELLDKKGVFAEFLMTYLTDVEEMADEKEEEIDEVKSEILPKLSLASKELSLSRSYGYNEIESKTFRRQSSVPNLSNNDESSEVDKLRRFSSYSITNLSLESLSRPHMNSQIIAESSPVASGTLIMAESMETGKVKLSTYTYYARAVGFKTIFFSVLFYMMAYGCSMGSSIWLSMWSNDVPNADGTQDEALRNLRLIVYGALGLSFASLTLLAGVVFVYGTTFAAGNLHRMLLDNILRSPMSFFDTTPLGRIINRFSKDIDILDTTMPQWLQQWLTSLFQVISTIIVISISTPVFVLLALPIAVIYYYLQRFYVSTSRQLKRLESVTRSPIYSHFSESVIGAATVRAFGRQGSFIRQSEEKVDENQLCYYPSIISNRWIGIRLEIIGNVLVFCAALLAVLGRETLSPGLVGLSVSYSLSITFILNWVVRMTSEVETNIVAVERVKEYTVTPTEAAWEIPESKPPPMWPTNGEVIFNGYSTRYRKGLDLVLRKATCSIKSGEKVGIVGRTGAGKSSLTLALFRIVEAASGSIVIDDIDIATLGLHDLRSRLTIIPQEPVLFSGSLRMNLDPFDNHSDEEIWKVLELSHLKSFASTLSKGLMHEINEGGDNLSVGQRQLVCLARALLRKTKILILDEATAAVDLETDDLIQTTIRKEFTECTVLTIAHRLNTIIDNDRVLVLDHGIIKEFDSPKTLTSKKSSIFYGMARDAGLVTIDADVTT